jgi:tetratricopeptide (TPR) repeat protein
VTLQSAQELRAADKHEQAREVLVNLARSSPADAVVQYEAACVHDFLGLEAEAVPFYLAALAGEMPAPLRRSAYTGLGSTYRTLGLFQQAHDTLVEGLTEFPQANELRVFLAMACYNLGESKSAVESLLRLLARTTNDQHFKEFSRAIEFYAQDIERTWPSSAA